jgi:hypothetical protein
MNQLKKDKMTLVITEGTRENNIIKGTTTYFTQYLSHQI